MDEYDFRFSHWCKENREQIVPILQEALWKTDGMLRLHINELLLKLNEADCAAGLFDGVQSSDGNLQKATLKILRRLPLAPLTDQSFFWKEPPFPISREDLLIALVVGGRSSQFRLCNGPYVSFSASN